MANEFNIRRTAKASFTLVNGSAASTLESGVYIPKGAIITGARLLAPSAVTLTGANGEVQFAVGDVNIVATSAISDLPAVSTPTIVALATTDGNYLTADGELNLVVGASSNSAATGTYDMYVDYLYA